MMSQPDQQIIATSLRQPREPFAIHNHRAMPARRSVSKLVGRGMPGVCFRLVSDIAQDLGLNPGPVIEESGVKPKMQQLHGNSQSRSGGKVANKQQIVK